MSIMRCEKHSRHWDSDFLEECPICANEEHDSDCATHNEPAYPNGPCDCALAATEGAQYPRVEKETK